MSSRTTSTRFALPERKHPTRWRRQRFEAQGRARGGTDDDDDQRPGPREMPPPQAPPARRVTAREETRLPHSEGEALRVTGRSRFANQMRMPLVLRMKHTVPSDDPGNPTIEQLYRMYNDESSIPIVRQQAAELIVKLNALPTDEINMLVSPRPDNTIGLRRQLRLRHHPPRTSILASRERLEGPLLDSLRRFPAMTTGYPR